MALVTLVGLALRLYHAGADLWIDEIATLHAFRDIPSVELLTTFQSANNHLLNTLLVKATTRAFGDAEWAVRLPAIVFGAATIPTLWLAGRRGLGPAGSLLAALLLATSYHHVFFSQNARGYASLVFFSIAAASLLSAGLRGARGKVWVLYVAAMLGALASLLHAFFVLAAHAVLALWWARRGPGRAGLRALAAVGLAGYGGLHLYASALAEAVRSVGSTYRTPAMGYRPVSWEHLQEWVRAAEAAAGPAGLLVVVAGLLVGAAGFACLHRGDPVLAWGLVGPPLVTALCVLAAGLNMTPRAYLLLLPAAMLCGAGGVLAVADRLASTVPHSRSSAVKAAAVGAMAVAAVAVNAAGLRAYYRYPKQDFRGAIRFAAARRGPADVLVGVYLAKWGLRHYGPGLGLHEGREFEVVQSVEELEGVRKAHPGSHLIALVTLQRANRLEYPDLDARLHERFAVAGRFPGTLGDGEVSVWEER